MTHFQNWAIVFKFGHSLCFQFWLFTRVKRLGFSGRRICQILLLQQEMSVSNPKAPSSSYYSSFTSIHTLLTKASNHCLMFLCHYSWTLQSLLQHSWILPEHLRITTIRKSIKWAQYWLMWSSLTLHVAWIASDLCRKWLSYPTTDAP